MSLNKVQATRTTANIGGSYEVQPVVGLSYGRTVFVVFGGAPVANQNIDASLISKTSVLRGGSLIVGASTLLAWAATILGGTVIIHPLLSVMLLISSVAFYLMSRLDR